MATQSLSSLFGASSTSGVSNGGLFGAGQAQKFARVFKAPEFDLPTKKVPEPIGEGGDVDPLEKPKKQRKERKPKSEASPDSEAVAAEPAEGGDKQDQSTIFVGNIPTTETVKSLTKFLKVYGEIESIRLRSVPIAGAKVDEAGNQDLVRKVCVNSKKFGEQKGSFNAYVKFKEASSATAALAANNKLLGTRHLRVDRSNPTLFDPKRSVFLGGLPHYADEEELRDFFAQVSVECSCSCTWSVVVVRMYRVGLRFIAVRLMAHRCATSLVHVCPGAAERPGRHRGPAHHP